LSWILRRSCWARAFQEEHERLEGEAVLSTFDGCWQERMLGQDGAVDSKEDER
jgi:hypothetical protein